MSRREAVGGPDSRLFDVFVGSFLGFATDDDASREKTMTAVRVNTVSRTISGYKTNANVITGVARPRPYVFVLTV